MALRKMLAKRLDGRRLTSQSVTPEISPLIRTVVPPNAATAKFHREYLTSPDSAEKGFFRRALDQSTARLPEFLSLPVGEKLREKLRGTDVTGDRLRLDCLSPPTPDPAADDSLFDGLSVDDAKKILRLSHVEKLKSKLRAIPENSISYSEFFRICTEGCENENQGAEFARMLDESGNVIVLGNVVFLRPELVAKSMEAIIAHTIARPNDPRREVLKGMERQKAVIDRKARELVRGELYCGLGFVLAQTLAAMRLTFWELSWDVMEPICFFVTSIHFALGYGFFLRTSTEPTFQGYFHRRFLARQKRLMEIHGFDIEKYAQLRKAFHPTTSFSDQEEASLGAFN
ncbi:Coiled-coil domain containing protein 109, C-terminal [Parasponia andersonii]|uniref:Coiled-coil domain containing protein 109, C-terminal n=1 Tax=Parasponia andersonii TaxID=3476 RepID=A0A2P5AIT3_PARAD|nr:Coiled-coil domain containing protein 109, C-terminal [Parasponia andersonii]